MNNDDVILVNDEYLDSDIAVISDTDCGIVINSQSIDTIIIDEDNPNTDQNDDIIEIIEIDKIENNIGQNKCLNVFDRIVKENKLLSEFIEKCLDIEHSEGMLRVINKSLLPVYDAVSDDYKASPEFRKLIHAKLRAIDVDPNHKFSHLKDMCETMKCHKFRKRKKVSFVTLSNDIKAKPTNPPEVPVHEHGTRLATKRKKTDDNDIIEVPIEYVPDPVIDLEEEPIDVIILEDGPVNNKENAIVNNSQENYNENNISNKPEYTEVPVVNNENSDLSNDNRFLVPKKSKVMAMTEEMIAEKIKNIENRIASYKKEIEKLEVLEVDNDTINSPYVRCERFKSEVVSMYKELCTLMGAEAVKRREIRLQVTDGRPELPVKNLEKLINDNIGPDGNPHFPDFCEVVECVVQANNEAKLGLNHTQITTEARRLFTNCGLALQQKRQQRDWRNMLGRVDYKLDDDPADTDPELLARLEENRRIGMKKEVDLLDTFVKMEYSRSNSISTNKHSGIQISEHCSDESDDGETESSVPTENIEKVVIENICDINTEMPKIGHVYYQEPRIETCEFENKEPNESISDTNSKLEARFTNGGNLEVLNVIINKEENVQGNKDSNLIETNSEFVTIGDINKVQINAHQVLSNNEEIDILKQNIKTEPRDTLKDMALFSDNFTATIIYIEDPFLVIEISSDSSDDESDS